MNAEQLDLARRLVACEQWRFKPGMLVTCPRLGPMFDPGRLIDPASAEADDIPRIDDYATAAILLRLACEASVTSPIVDLCLGKWSIELDASWQFVNADLGTAAARALLAVWEKR